MKHFAKILLLTSSLGFMHHAIANQALAYNRLNFEISTSQNVINDEIHATLSKTLQAPDAKGIATQLNPIMNAVSELKSRYPDVTLTTGSHHSHPNYDKNGRITGFTARASVNLKSQNSEQISQLIADLQSHLTLDNLDFSVSDDAQKRIQDELKTRASQDFMNEAKSLTQLWGARDYRLVNANLNGSQDYYYKSVTVAEASAAYDASANPSAVAQNFEVGETKITYTISGTIELIK